MDDEFDEFFPSSSKEWFFVVGAAFGDCLGESNVLKVGYAGKVAAVGHVALVFLALAGD